MELTVNLGENSYPIYIENGILPHAGEYISKFYHGKKIILISDDNVFPLYGETVLNSLQNYECHMANQQKVLNLCLRFIPLCLMRKFPEAILSSLLVAA